MKQKIHIIGCGQVGTIMANYFVQKNFPVTIYESGTNNAQVPWGWMRRVTLQQKERYRLPLEVFNLPEKYIVRGPMVISTSNKSRKVKWEYWLKETKTDAHLLTNKEASTLNINEKFNLLCDTNDHLFDFQNYKMDLRKQLKLYTQWIGGSSVNRLFWKNDHLNGIGLINGNFYSVRPDEKVLLCVGNQTNHFFSVPIGGITLQYAVKDAVHNVPYIAHWMDESSVQYFPTFTKFGCGMNGILSTVPPVRFWSKFLPLLRKDNYFGFNPTHDAQKKWNLQKNDFKSCQVDITPDFLPIIQPVGSNLTVACGFSGSGFTVYEPWFQTHVREVMNHATQKNPFQLRRGFQAKSFLY
jgi:hypothetical protein